MHQVHGVTFRSHQVVFFAIFCFSVLLFDDLPLNLDDACGRLQPACSRSCVFALALCVFVFAMCTSEGSWARKRLNATKCRVPDHLSLWCRQNTREPCPIDSTLASQCRFHARAPG